MQQEPTDERAENPARQHALDHLDHGLTRQRVRGVPSGEDEEHPGHDERRQDAEPRCARDGRSVRIGRGAWYVRDRGRRGRRGRADPRQPGQEQRGRDPDDRRRTRSRSTSGAGCPSRPWSRAPRAARPPVGRSARPDVLIARNSAIASVAVPFLPFRRSSSPIALIPNGVAALARPSMLLEMFRIIALIAGWSVGTEGKSRRITGEIARATTRMRPASCATRISPRKNAITPTRPSARA